MGIADSGIQWYVKGVEDMRRQPGYAWVKNIFSQSPHIIILHYIVHQLTHKITGCFHTKLRNNT